MSTEQPVAQDGLQNSLSPGNSVSTGSHKMRHSPDAKKDSFIGVFTADIWRRLLPKVHPFQLLRISRSSRSLHDLITVNETILRKSRIKFMPEIPKPVLDITENELFNLIYGFGCQKCPSKTATTCWAFRARLCHLCMNQYSEKEYNLVKDDAALSVRQHMWVFTAIPFGMIDDTGKWIPNPSAYRPNIGLTRIYWKDDIVKAMTEFEKEKLHSREELWVKNREDELEYILRGIHKLETYEADVRQQKADRKAHEKIGCQLSSESESRANHDGHLADVGTINTDVPKGPAYQVVIPEKGNESEAYESPTHNYSHRSAGTTYQNAPAQHHQNGNPKPSHETSKDYKNIHNNRNDNLEPSQATTRDRLASYARERYAKWRGKITEENAARFVVDVFRHCRESFISQKPVRHRLTLDDLKWLYDTQIKSLVSKVIPSMELFLCKECPENPRRWLFEPLIQHWCAKHTAPPGRRLVKVDWKNDWPSIGPFAADPPPPSGPRSMRKETPRNGYQNTSRLDRNNFRGYKNHSADHYQSELNRPGKNEGHRDRIETMATDAREAWIQYGAIEGLQPSGHIFAVITKAARKFQSKFAEELPLPLFKEAVVKHPYLQPLRDIKDLECLECWKRHEKRKDGPSKMTYTAVELMIHFAAVHERKPKGHMDWSRHMIRLPYPRNISGLVQNDGSQKPEEDRNLLEDIFPWAFASHSLQGKRAAYKNSIPNHREQHQEEYGRRTPVHRRPVEHSRDSVDDDYKYGVRIKSKYPEYPSARASSYDRSTNYPPSTNAPYFESNIVPATARDNDSRRDSCQYVVPPKGPGAMEDRKRPHPSDNQRFCRGSDDDYPPRPPPSCPNDSPLKHSRRHSASDFIQDSEPIRDARIDYDRRPMNDPRDPNDYPRYSPTDSRHPRGDLHDPHGNSFYRTRSRSPPPGYSRPPAPLLPLHGYSEYPVHQRPSETPHSQYAGMYHSYPPVPSLPAAPIDTYRVYRFRVDGPSDYYGHPESPYMAHRRSEAPYYPPAPRHGYVPPPPIPQGHVPPPPPPSMGMRGDDRDRYAGERYYEPRTDSRAGYR